MALALNNLKRVDIPLNKETKSNPQSKYINKGKIDDKTMSHTKRKHFEMQSKIFKELTTLKIN